MTNYTKMSERTWKQRSTRLISFSARYFSTLNICQSMSSLYSLNRTKHRCMSLLKTLTNFPSFQKKLPWTLTSFLFFRRKSLRVLLSICNRITKCSKAKNQKKIWIYLPKLTLSSTNSNNDCNLLRFMSSLNTLKYVFFLLFPFKLFLYL